MQVYVARHGKTNYNELGICNCNPAIDVHLNESGIEQAKSLAQKLQDEHIQHIYVSELRRTSQTAEFINKYHKVPVSIDDRINDNNTGFDGQHFSVYVSALEKAGKEQERTIRFNDGESLQDVDDRVSKFFDSLRSVSFDSVLIVTSEAIIQSMFRYCDGQGIKIVGGREIIQGNYITLNLE
jgi:broad specificity phosphatase PhoE